VGADDEEGSRTRSFTTSATARREVQPKEKVPHEEDDKREVTYYCQHSFWHLQWSSVVGGVFPRQVFVPRRWTRLPRRLGIAVDVP